MGHQDTSAGMSDAIRLEPILHAAEPAIAGPYRAAEHSGLELSHRACRGGFWRSEEPDDAGRVPAKRQPGGLNLHT